MVKKNPLTDAQANKLYDTVEALGIAYIPHKLIAKGAQEVQKLLDKKEVEPLPCEEIEIKNFLSNPEAGLQNIIGVTVNRGTTMRYEESLVYFKKSLKNYNKSKIGTPLYVSYNIGITYMNLEKYSEAIPFLEKVLIHDALPDDMRSTITYYLGKCHYGCLNFSPALRLFSEVLRVNRKNSVLLLVPKSDPKCYKGL